MDRNIPKSAKGPDFKVEDVDLKDAMQRYANKQDKMFKKKMGVGGVSIASA